MKPPEAPKLAALIDLSGKAALVTGAGRGIGAGIARRFGQAGAAVAVHYRSSADGARAVVEEIEETGGRAIALHADVTDGAEVARLVDETVNALGDLDILVNNAGIYPVSPLLEMADEEWDAVVDANLKSVHVCTRIAAARMVAQGGGGAIVNIASIEGLAPAKLHAHYTSAKAGVLMHTRAAALELGPEGIRVNAVAPGLIWKPGIEEDWPEGVQRWLEAVPLGSLGRPEDVADACLFLASPASRWVTGASIAVDGGMLSKAVF
ncbi:MAG: glucose 1-dehydrogenase [bacterium]|nr:glucose 1-dehydrogenase [bacterium]